ncbi:Protein lin-9 [Amphibalanus amphitrite]|uniref:Protein lin-9 n=1 Tax=Amphibalanus amphitrite TaxID=1232801 RepID=A0A6A4VXJ0_AMPAM|nr:Protein lin-9 [Amphibalanus amphitrite]
MPQRIRKKNRLYFDDDHVSGPAVRASPKKSPAPPRERAAEPTTPVRGRLTPLRGAAAASPVRAVVTTPKKTPTRAAAVAAAAQLHKMSSSPAAAPAPAPAPAPVPAPILPRTVAPAAPALEAGRVTINRQREAHALGLRLRNLLKLPKAHKFVCYEWFYSTIDE